MLCLQFLNVGLKCFAWIVRVARVVDVIAVVNWMHVPNDACAQSGLHPLLLGIMKWTLTAMGAPRRRAFCWRLGGSSPWGLIISFFSSCTQLQFAWRSFAACRTLFVCVLVWCRVVGDSMLETHAMQDHMYYIDDFARATLLRTLFSGLLGRVLVFSRELFWGTRGRKDATRQTRKQPMILEFFRFRVQLRDLQQSIPPGAAQTLDHEPAQREQNSRGVGTRFRRTPLQTDEQYITLRVCVGTYVACGTCLPGATMCFASWVRIWVFVIVVCTGLFAVLFNCRAHGKQGVLGLGLPTQGRPGPGTLGFFIDHRGTLWGEGSAHVLSMQLEV